MASFPGGYPAARRLDLVEELHGHRVADPYRWLEDPDSAETQGWLAAQESLWSRYREGLTHREAFTARVRELLRVGSVSMPGRTASQPARCATIAKPTACYPNLAGFFPLPLPSRRAPTGA